MDGRDVDTAQLRSELLRFTRTAYPNIDIQIEWRAEDSMKLVIYFIEPTFSVLYPAQRFHYLADLIPRQFVDEHLAHAIWFELAPGEKPKDLVYADEELIEAIAPDVMKVLLGSGAFDALDDLMCPVSPGLPRAKCFGDYRHSRNVLLTRGFKEEELFDVFHVLMSKGAVCDCEILYNAADSNRLKNEYWRLFVEGRETYDPHHDSK
jgi:Protein of unknown function (DUF2695)